MGTSQGGYEFRPFPSAPLHLYICWLSPIQARVTPTIQPYWDARHSLSFIGDSLVYGSRIVVPSSLRSGGPGCLTFCPPGRHLDESTRSDLCVLARHVGQHCQPPSAVRTVRWHSTLQARFTRLPTTDTGIPLPTCRGWLLSLSRSMLSGVRWPIYRLGFHVRASNWQKWCMVAAEEPAWVVWNIQGPRRNIYWWRTTTDLKPPTFLP